MMEHLERTHFGLIKSAIQKIADECEREDFAGFADAIASMNPTLGFATWLHVQHDTLEPGATVDDWVERAALESLSLQGIAPPGVEEWFEEEYGSD